MQTAISCDVRLHTNALCIHLELFAMTVKADPTGSTGMEEEERPDEDAESVFSDSEEEEGELIGGRRDVASDAEDEGDTEAHGDRGRAAGTRELLPSILMVAVSVTGGEGSATRGLSASSSNLRLVSVNPISQIAIGSDSLSGRHGFSG